MGATRRSFRDRADDFVKTATVAFRYMPTEDPIEAVDLGALVGQLRRRLGVILVCLVAFPFLAIAVSLLQEKQYSATASLLFRDPAFDQKLFGSTFLAPSQDPDREAATNTELVSLEAVARRAARRVGGRLTQEDVAAMVKVAPAGQADVVTIVATDRSPEFAARLANTLGSEYVNFRKDADRTKIREAEALIGRQIQDLEPSARGGSKGRSLEQRADELRVLGSLQTGNAELVEQATVPRSPSSPKTLRNGILGAILGLIVGVMLALLLERLDHRVRDPKEMEDLFDRPILGGIPSSKSLEGRGTATALASAEAESFRLLRANLRYFNVDRDVRSVLVTSAAPADGKSTIGWNLASAAAGAGVRTLVIEADLRHPGLGAALGSTGSIGLSSVLAGESTLEGALQEVPVSDGRNGTSHGRVLHVLLSGPLPPNPTDLIESDRMRELLSHAEEAYELVVIDTPPTSVVSDAIPLVSQVGGVLVVGRLGKTTRGSMLQLRNQLANLNAPVLGVVINAVGRESAGYGYGAGYSYSYGYGEREREGVPAH